MVVFLGARAQGRGHRVQCGAGQRQHPGGEEQLLQAPDTQARQEEQVSKPLVVLLNLSD